MTLASRVLARVYRLSPALTHDIEVERGIPVTMPDGVVLLADRLAARGRTDLPTILIRTPYGRRSLTSWMIGTRLLAERGFNVVVQSCRGTDGSGGVLDPFRTEKEDGLATVAWLRRQSWYSGRFATYGPSYLGIVQWAIAQDAGTELKAIAPLIAPSNMGAFITQGGGFQLEVMLWWTCVMKNGHARVPSSLHRVGAWLSQLKGLALQRNELAAFERFLPVSGLDVATTGSTIQWWQDWTGHSAADEWWSRIDFRSGIEKVGAPACMVAGWDDIFLVQQIGDFERLSASGRKPQLLIGPWDHVMSWPGPALRESLAWFRAHLLDDPKDLRAKPVRLYVMGANEWRDYEAWPPVDAPPMKWHLQPNGALGVAEPAESAPDRYLYDPSNPTPSLGGKTIVGKRGRAEMGRIERRSDIVCYTSEPLASDLEVIGPISAELFVASSGRCVDFVVHLCDVDAAGRSMSVCEGFTRIDVNEVDKFVERSPVHIQLAPTAYRFKRGHRLRVHVASGAHPRYARNLGLSQAVASGIEYSSSWQTIFHDPIRPSAIVLPVSSMPKGR